MHVFYDTDNKSYPDVIENDPNVEHAEQVFKRGHLSALRSRIAADRAGGRIKTPTGQPVLVTLQLNRIPCPNCSSILASLSGAAPDLRFSVQASSASNTASTEVTIDYIETLLAGGVEVSTLKIFEAIRNKIIQLLQASKAKQIKPLTDNQYYEIRAAIAKIDQNISQEKRLAEMIEEAKKRHAAKTALAKVPPVGSGV
jgi:hypothetical protein